MMKKSSPAPAALLAFLSLAAPLAALTLTGCKKADPKSGAAPQQPAPIQVRLAPVERRSVQRTIDVTGTLYGQEEVTVSAKVAGRIASTAVDLGDEVQSGETLAQIEQTDFALELEERRRTLVALLAKLGLDALPEGDFDVEAVPGVRRARAEDANAKARLDRARQLFEQKPPLLSEQDFADIRTQAEVSSRSAEVEALTARAALADARTQAASIAMTQNKLAETDVRAPASSDGSPIRFRVAQRFVSAGELVNERQALYSLVASDVIKFRGAVPERFMAGVHAGQTAAITVQAYDRSFDGRVSRVSPRIDERSRTFEVEILVPNPGEQLRPGGFGHAAIIYGADDNVAFVPEAAVVTFAGVQRVFDVSNGKAVEHRVKTGIVQGSMIEIEGEFTPTQVIVDGLSSLSNKAPVTVEGQGAAVSPPVPTPGASKTAE